MICLIFLGLNSSYAQTKLVVNGGVQFPTGDLKSMIPGADLKMGFGLSVDGEFTISQSQSSTIAVTVQSSYNRFSYDTPAGFTGDANLGLATFMGGIKAFFDQFYVGGFAGLVSPSLNVTGVTATFNSEFGFGGTVGVRIDKIDVNAKYYTFSSSGTTLPWFGINVGYVFDL